MWIFNRYGGEIQLFDRTVGRNIIFFGRKYRTELERKCRQKSLKKYNFLLKEILNRDGREIQIFDRKYNFLLKEILKRDGREIKIFDRKVERNIIFF